ncbi:MAG: hypothetical protein J1G02_05120 [Clostridiales bacterium]|nr:hypothetical protein [Clostridiales bacterium]
MIEFKYDEKTYVKMSMRISWWLYAIIMGIVLAIFVWIASMYVSDYINGETDLAYMLIVLGIYLCVVAALVTVLFVSIRKQLSKSFAMYSANGVLVQRAEITQEQLTIYNVSRQSVTKINRRDIKSVKNYKKFFVISTITNNKWAVPFDEHTQILYDVLTGVVPVEQLPEISNDSQENSPSEKDALQQTSTSQTDALSFEYNLTEQQAISMLTKVISVRYRIILAVAIVFAAATLLFLMAFVGNYIAGRDSVTSLIFTLLFAIITVFAFAVYANKNKSGKTLGGSYFRQQSKDGQCHIRVELYDQGIVVVNKLLESRVYFRFSDMDRVRLFTDFYIVEFKSKEVLPVPLTDNTRALYDILNNGVKRK